MKPQLMKRLQALEEKSGALNSKTFITVIDEDTAGMYVADETIYGRNGQTKRNCFILEAESMQEAVKLYKKPEGCTDGIVFIKDYGEMWLHEEVAAKLAEMMTTDELKRLITEPTEHGTFIDETGSEVTIEEYDIFFNRMMAKYAGDLMHEMGIPKQDLQKIESNIKESLNKKIKERMKTE